MIGDGQCAIKEREKGKGREPEVWQNDFQPFDDALERNEKLVNLVEYL